MNVTDFKIPFTSRAPPGPKGRKYRVIIYLTTIYWIHTFLDTEDTAVYKLDRLFLLIQYLFVFSLSNSEPTLSPGCLGRYTERNIQSRNRRERTMGGREIPSPGRGWERPPQRLFFNETWTVFRGEGQITK